jgi:hypothetical protein
MTDTPVTDWAAAFDCYRLPEGTYAGGSHADALADVRYPNGPTRDSGAS